MKLSSSFERNRLGRLPFPWPGRDRRVELLRQGVYGRSVGERGDGVEQDLRSRRLQVEGDQRSCEGSGRERLTSTTRTWPSGLHSTALLAPMALRLMTVRLTLVKTIFGLVLHTATSSAVMVANRDPSAFLAIPRTSPSFPYAVWICPPLERLRRGTSRSRSLVTAGEGTGSEYGSSGVDEVDSESRDADPVGQYILMLNRWPLAQSESLETKSLQVIDEARGVATASDVDSRPSNTTVTRLRLLLAPRTTSRLAKCAKRSSRAAAASAVPRGRESQSRSSAIGGGPFTLFSVHAEVSPTSEERTPCKVQTIRRHWHCRRQVKAIDMGTDQGRAVGDRPDTCERHDKRVG